MTTQYPAGTVLPSDIVARFPGWVSGGPLRIVGLLVISVDRTIVQSCTNHVASGDHRSGILDATRKRDPSRWLPLAVQTSMERWREQSAFPWIATTLCHMFPSGCKAASIIFRMENRLAPAIVFIVLAGLDSGKHFLCDFIQISVGSVFIPLFQDKGIFMDRTWLLKKRPIRPIRLMVLLLRLSASFRRLFRNAGIFRDRSRLLQVRPISDVVLFPRFLCLHCTPQPGRLFYIRSAIFPNEF